MTERRTKSQFDPAETALADAIIDINSVESDIDSFFAQVRNEQTRTHTKTLARYCKYVDLLYSAETPLQKQQAFLAGATYGLWVAEIMAERAGLDVEAMRRSLAENRALPVELTAEPGSPDLEDKLMSTLYATQNSIVSDEALCGVEEILQLSDVPPEELDEAQCGMLYAMGEARFAMNQQIASREADTALEYMESDEFTEEVSSLGQATRIEDVPEIDADTDFGYDPYESIDRDKVATYLWHQLQQGDGVSETVNEWAYHYRGVDLALYQRLVMTARMLEPTDEQGRPLDESWPTATHFFTGAVLAARALDIESLEVRQGWSDWHEAWTDTTVRCYDPPHLSAEEKNQLRQTELLRIGLDLRSRQLIAEIPREYLELLERIETQDGYRLDYSVAHRMGFALAYSEGSEALGAYVRGDREAEVEQILDEAASTDYDSELAELLKGK